MKEKKSEGTNFEEIPWAFKEIYLWDLSSKGLKQVLDKAVPSIEKYLLRKYN